MLNLKTKQQKTTNKTDALYSFDIFDTLITRRCATPKGIFAIMRKILVENSADFNISRYLRENFYDLRIQTECFVRENHASELNKQDISLEDIYRKLQLNNGFDDETLNKLIDLELSIEKKNLVPIEENINRVKQLKNEGKTVVLISDMYLSSNVLREILVNFDPIFKDIEIFVSGEIAKAKFSGDLYDYVKEKFNISYSCWHHFGDNKYSDYKIAKRLGIKSKKYDFIKLKSYEKMILKNNEHDVSKQVYTGISKLTRLLNKNKSSVYDFGASFSSIALYSYASWLVETAMAENIQELHFVARDGYILYLIAQKIVEKRNLDIKINYLYGSRKVYRLAIEETYQDYLKMMFRDYHEFFSLDFIAKRLYVDAQTIKKYAPSFSKYANNQILRGSKIKKLENELANSEGFKAEVIASNKDKVDILKEYLTQEIDFNKKYALVDVCGTGGSQILLQNIINSIKREKYTMFYFHNDVWMMITNDTIMRQYCPTEYYYPYFIEIICRSTQGQTIGFERKSGRVEPILEYETNGHIEKWGFSEYIKSILDFTAQMLEFEDINGFKTYSVRQFRQYYKILLDGKDKNLAEVIGTVPYRVIGEELSKCEAARKYHIWDLFIKNKKNFPFPFISRARTGQPLCAIMKLMEKAKKVRKFFLDIYINKKRKQFYIRFLGIKLSYSKLIWGE